MTSPVASAEQSLREARDQLERKVAERTAELRRSEAYLTEAQRLSHTGSWALDVASGTYEYVSEEDYRIFGFDPRGGLPTREAVFGRIHPDDRARWKAKFEKSLREKTDSFDEYRIVLPDGTVKHIHTTRHAVLNAAGELEKWVGTSADITERKRAEEALRVSNAYNRSLIEASLDPLVTIGRDGKITDVNAATESATGRSRDELIGTDFCDYFTEPEKAGAGYEHVFREGAVRDYPLELRHRDGRVISVLYNASVYRDEEGRVMGVFAAARDITERQRAAEQASRLAAIVESSEDAILSKTLEGVITSWNSGAERIYGYTAEEVIGRSISILTDPGQPEETPELLARVGQGESVNNYETVRRRKDGTVMAVSLALSPIRDASGRIVGASTIARDITERKRAEEAVRAERRRFNEVLDVLPALVALLSPDYQVPFANRYFLERFGPPNGRPCYEHFFGRGQPCEHCETFLALKTGAAPLGVDRARRPRIRHGRFPLHRR